LDNHGVFFICRLGDIFALPHEVAPWMHYVSRLHPPPRTSPQDVKDYLATTFLTLLDRVIADLRRLALSLESAAASSSSSATQDDGVDDAHMSGPSDASANDVQLPPRKLSELSYNLVLSTTYMLLVPRKTEKASLDKDNEASTTNTVSINSLGFVGKILVKNERQREALVSLGPKEALRRVTWDAVLEDLDEVHRDEP
jgi:hypothetical protein